MPLPHSEARPNSTCWLPQLRISGGPISCQSFRHSSKPWQKKTCLRWASASLYCLEVDVVTLCSATSMWMVWVQTTGSMSINFLRWWKRLLLRLQKLKSGIYLEGWTPISTSPSRSTRSTPRLYAMFPSFCSESNVYPCQSKNRATIIISSH